MNDKIGVLFDGSLEGFFTVIYYHYYYNLNPESIEIDGSFQQKLGLSYIYIATNREYAAKVAESLPKKISDVAYNNIYRSYLYSAESKLITNSKYFHMYNYILLGYKSGKKVDNYKTIDHVLNVQKLSNAVGMEAHLLTGFARFSETNQGIYYGDISPKHNVLPIIAGHFADRFSTSQWVLHDVSRNMAAISDGNRFIIVDTPDDINIEYSENEGEYRELWATFFKSITIEDRINRNLQRNMLPIRFRKHMTEFMPSSD